MNDREFRNAMGRFATGITVISAENAGETYGMTANAFISVSLNPKLVLVSIANNAKILHHIQQSKKYAISFLSSNQKELSMQFAGQLKKAKPYKFDLFNAQPVIGDALANITCNVYAVYEVGDHTLIIGEVTAIRLEGGSPLLYYEGKYQLLNT